MSGGPLLQLGAPLAGWATPLEELPDPVFAGRMLGDGVAIDPTGSVLHAPCPGEVVALAATRHAVTLRAAGGQEILMHVGIETVALAGEGFEALVAIGDRVEAGHPLLRFDLELLASRARSLLTPVIVLGTDCQVQARHTGKALAVGEPLYAIAGRTVAACATAPAGGMQPVVERTMTVRLAHGLHARPAGRIVQAVRASGAQLRLVRGSIEADGRSVTALMLLGLQRGDAVTIRAEGAQAQQAVDDVALLLADDHVVVPASSPAASAAKTAAPGADVLVGTVASRGLALGPALHLREAVYALDESGAEPARERSRLESGFAALRTTIAARSAQGSSTQREIATAHAALLDDPVLLEAAMGSIAAGHGAGYAWHHAVAGQAHAMEQLDDPYLRERAADLRDIGAQLLAILGHRPEGGPTPMPDGAIVLARELLPSQFAALDATRLAGICTAEGGPTSHVAIMASAAGVPMLVAAGAGISGVKDGQTLVLDAEAGQLWLAPDERRLAEARTTLQHERERRVAERRAAQSEARTADGQRVHVHANLGSPDEALTAVGLGAEGCGLLRTEFLFLDRRTPPDETEQASIYQRIASALGHRSLTIRTLDAGGDKPIEYLPLPPEENPALGLRGVRTSLRRPDLLQDQLRAILRVSPAGQCRLLLPMITDIVEVAQVRAELRLAMQALRIDVEPSLGVMIETPAAALLADTLAPHVDFFSIGTNDLTQYTLAMDRGHPELAPRLDGLHPAVLRLIDLAVRSAHASKREVAVCGNLAIDPQAIPILLGLGVDELSVAYAAVPAVKARISRLEMRACHELARRALACSTAAAVRRLEGE
jgi:phosphocarrier protein FPr/phosphocarrier protein